MLSITPPMMFHKNWMTAKLNKYSLCQVHLVQILTKFVNSDDVLDVNSH